MQGIRKNIDIITSTMNMVGGSVAGATNWAVDNGRDDKRKIPGLDIDLT